MPIYEYKCGHCSETFEVLQKFSDEPLTECVLCSEGPVKKLISASSFVLKGAGFYVNDYKKKDAPSEKKSSDSSSSSSSSTDSSSSTSSASESKTSSKETAKAA